MENSVQLERPVCLLVIDNSSPSIFFKVNVNGLGKERERGGDKLIFVRKRVKNSPLAEAWSGGSRGGKL